MKLVDARVRELPPRPVVEPGPSTHGPASNSRRTWTERGGLLIQLFDELGNVGYGEASPLPGYSPDSLPDCREALESALSSLASRPIDELDGDGDGINLDRLAHASASLRAVPAARFGLETALLDLCGARQGRPAWELLAPPNHDPTLRRTAALVTGEPSTWIDACSSHVARGATTLKLKLGRELDRELDGVARVRDSVGPAVAIRVDFNRSLPLERAPGAFRRLSDSAVELCEEPVATVALSRLQESGVPIGLDESLQTLDPTDPHAWEPLEKINIRVLVLKPAALGGFTRCLELARWAEPRGIGVVVSHIFDGPIALIGAAALALVLPSGLDHGLAPHTALDAWPRAPLPMFRQHRIDPWRSPGLGLEHQRGLA